MAVQASGLFAAVPNPATLAPPLGPELSSPVMSPPADIEAQASPSPPAYTHHASCPSAEFEWTTHSTENFFESPTLPPSSLSKDCYGCRVSEIMSRSSETLPEYSPPKEPRTLSRLLFKWGFVFPPLWVMGTIILLSPSLDLESSSHASLSTGRPDERILAEVRRVEVKWARRCLSALVILICVAGTVGFITWWVLRDG